MRNLKKECQHNEKGEIAGQARNDNVGTNPSLSCVLRRMRLRGKVSNDDKTSLQTLFVIPHLMWNLSPNKAQIAGQARNDGVVWEKREIAGQGKQ